ncbi:hypothetical protein QJS66_06020 [Kocuria rhizophila]|nr:hypothetical protein QJS66_06020 [Kocuria rhizophila]
MCNRDVDEAASAGVVVDERALSPQDYAPARCGTWRACRLRGDDAAAASSGCHALRRSGGGAAQP